MFFCVVSMLFVVSVFSVVAADAQIRKVNVSSTNPFAVYTDNGNRRNNFYPSGWIGDFGDIRFTQAAPDAQSGDTCIKISYSARSSQGAKWAGIYWQYPEGNWGQYPEAFDLTGATQLTFWARGERGGEVVAAFKMGGIVGEFSDSDFVEIGPIRLKKTWRKYTINLKRKNLSRISGGFCVVFSKQDNPNGCVIFIDEIKYH